MPQKKTRRRSSGCKNCGGTEWTDEDHQTTLLDNGETAPREDGAPCPFCNPLANAKDRASAWKRLIGSPLQTSGALALMQGARKQRAVS